MSFLDTVKKGALKTAFSYIERNPEENLTKLMDWADRLAGGGYAEQRASLRRVIEDKEFSTHRLMMSVFDDTDKSVLKATFNNFFINGNIVGRPDQAESREKYGCPVPWAFLVEPGLDSLGDALSYNEMDALAAQGQELGVYIYVFAGLGVGARKAELVRLAKKHDDCQFFAFADAASIDGALADDLFKVKNIIPVIDLEGTPGRIWEAMDNLTSRGLIFGVSCVCTTRNKTRFSSDRLLDAIAARGAKFFWYCFDAPASAPVDPEIVLKDAEREEMHDVIHHVRGTKPIFAMDFDHDGKYLGGAGDQWYVRVRADGGLDAPGKQFIKNIHTSSLLDALQS